MKNIVRFPLFAVLCLCAAVLCVSGCCTADKTENAGFSLYVTRHAQRGPRTQWKEEDRNAVLLGDMINGELKRPQEDSISPFGVEQALCLGSYLKQIGFHGKVYSCMTYRNMQTAVAIVMGYEEPVFYPYQAGRAVPALRVPSLKIIPEPLLQSRAYRKMPEKGMSVAELQARFPGYVEFREVPELWFLANEQEDKTILNRMRGMLKDILADNGENADLLLVTHSSAISALLQACGEYRRDPSGQLPPVNALNCCLYEFHFGSDGKVEYVKERTAEYLPPELRTYNFSPAGK